LDDFTLFFQDYGSNKTNNTTTTTNNNNNDSNNGRSLSAVAREELEADVRSLVRHYGLVIVRGALSDVQVEEMKTLADATQRRVCTLLDAKQIPYNDPINNTETIRFQELAVRCHGRMDVRYNLPDLQNKNCMDKDHNNNNDNDDNNHDSTPSSSSSSSTSLMTSIRSLTDGLASSVLHGAEPSNLVYAGWIFSFPGSVDQPWHQDGSPLFEKGTESLPSYALNIFCGLHDDDNDNDNESIILGPTEFVVGSHDRTPEQTMIDRTYRKDDTIISAVLGKGDILLYDYRICHRGTSNLSNHSVSCRDDHGSGEGNETKSTTITTTTKKEQGVIRKVLYLMYARPWFKEHLNFGDRSLASL